MNSPASSAPQIQLMARMRLLALILAHLSAHFNLAAISNSTEQTSLIGVNAAPPPVQECVSGARSYQQTAIGLLNGLGVQRETPSKTFWELARFGSASCSVPERAGIPRQRGRRSVCRGASSRARHRHAMPISRDRVRHKLWPMARWELARRRPAVALTLMRFGRPCSRRAASSVATTS